MSKDDDEKLWDRVKRTAEPLKNKNRVLPKHDNKTTPRSSSRTSRRADKTKAPSVLPQQTSKEITSSKTSKPDIRGKDGIDSRNWERFVKGKMPIEASLDLHGMTQDQAHRHLTAFIQQQYAIGKRFLLIITGKGKKTGQIDAWGNPIEGVLKKNFNHWIEEPALKEKILKVASAQQHHGGGGAFYILLKRLKD